MQNIGLFGCIGISASITCICSSNTHKCILRVLVPTYTYLYILPFIAVIITRRFSGTSRDVRVRYLDTSIGIADIKTKDRSILKKNFCKLAFSDTPLFLTHNL